MEIEELWPKLKPSTRSWLIENNGDVVSADVVEEIEQIVGPIDDDAGWVGEYGRSGLYLSDDAVDWVEAAANEEDPDES